MIAICEKCGKKYRIDPAIIKGKQARLRCKSCNNVITVVKPEAGPPPLPNFVSELTEESTPIPARTKVTPPRPIRRKLGRVGLRAKMLILFLFIPILLVITASLLNMRQVDILSSSLTKEGIQTASKTTEDMVTKRAQAISSMIKSYLLTHPQLKKALFNYDLTFRRVALQKIGLTGFTALYERLGSEGIWRARAHPDPNFVGTDVRKLKEYFGESYPQFVKVLSSIKGKKQSSGYFMARDFMGKVRQNFMVCVPVEGTSYIASATCYPDEFTKPAKLMEVRARKLAIGTRNIIIGIMVGTLILIGLVVTIYGQRLTGKIKGLTAAAELISVGELDIEIEKKMPNDELGDLADAFSRMQTSIRLSIERLHKRR